MLEHFEEEEPQIDARGAPRHLSSARIAMGLGATLFFGISPCLADGAPADASAKPPEPTTSVENATEASIGSGTRDAATARGLFKEAEAKYREGDVEGALERMTQAQALSGRAELLFNVAEMNRELGRCAAAVEAYEGYLARATSGRYRDIASTALARLRLECPPPATLATRSVGAPRGAEPLAPGPSATPTARLFGWTAIGLGAASLAGSLVFALKAHDAEHQLEAYDRQQVDSQEPWDKGGGPALEREGTRYRTWEVALAVSGGALAAGGILLLTLAASPKSAPKVILVPDRGGARATYTLSF